MDLLRSDTTADFLKLPKFSKISICSGTNKNYPVFDTCTPTSKSVQQAPPKVFSCNFNCKASD